MNKTPIEMAESLLDTPGDFVEIGAGYGETTVPLLEMVKGTNKMVVVIDPFEKGWDKMPKSYSYPYPKEKFVDAVKGLEDNLMLIEQSSQDVKELSVNPIAFAFVDGLQTKGAVAKDLELVKHAKVICVDDYNRDREECKVKDDVDKFVKKTKRKLFINERYIFII